jgi:hypothetical protein
LVTAQSYVNLLQDMYCRLRRLTNW